MDPLTRNWVRDKHLNPQEIDDEDLQEKHNDIPSAEQSPLLAFSSTQTSVPSHSNDLIAFIFNIVTSLSDEFRGFRTHVDVAFE
ncbi:hypothetical protein J1N35_001284 [Gossypium stocksii]|uniref:Uncharacterized protein n=1 Tax=Gossypium stocksii TaxID=47602 RepID=A0A9D3WK40_9ROSI|nr:hypothetical protein J1N35_001284 [Gossypium stocksii]